jgi:hypothetical protein
MKHERIKMCKVEFEHCIQDKVRTMLGDKGIVRMCALDDAGIKYYVNLKGGLGAWYPEDEVIKCPLK